MEQYISGKKNKAELYMLVHETLQVVISVSKAINIIIYIVYIYKL